MQPILSLSSGLLKDIADPAARSLILACVAAVAIGAFRVRAVAWKAAIWRGVLVVALAMPLLGSLLPSVRVPVPVPEFAVHPAVVPSSDTAVAPNGNRTMAVPVDRATHPDVVNSSGLEEAPPVAAVIQQPIAWAPILTGLYLAIALLLLGRIFVGAAFGKRLVRDATPIGDAGALRRVAIVARRAGLAVQPLLAESDALIVPVTLRVRRPAILLPASWTEWDEAKLSAVLAHEMSHVARRDAFFQQLALIHRAVFWFSPLAWWLPRHLDDLAEQASDEAALACGMERSRYAETLLGFMGALENSHSRVWWQGLAMAKSGRAEKRVDRILAWRNAMPNKLQKWFLAGVAVLAAPVVVLTASANPFFFDSPQSSAPTAPQPQTPPAAAVAPEPTPSAHRAVKASAARMAASPVPATAVAPAMPRGPEVRVNVRPYGAPQAAAVVLVTPSAAAAPVLPAVRMVPRPSALAPAPPNATLGASIAPPAPGVANIITPAPPAARIIGQTGGVSGGVQDGVRGGAEGGVYNDVFDREGPRFAIVTKGSDSVIMSGSSEDAAHAKALRSKIPGDFIWFERDEKPYIIRDEATVQKAEQLWQPVQELGRQQEALGKKQEALGKQQEALGTKMETVRVKIPDLSGEMDKLKAEIKQLSANGGTIEQIGDLQSEIGELQSRIGEVQSQTSSQQGEIGREQGELGRKQGELGQQQGELGARQGELSRQAARQMKQLLDDAISRGLAQPE